MRNSNRNTSQVIPAFEADVLVVTPEVWAEIDRTQADRLADNVARHRASGRHVDGAFLNALETTLVAREKARSRQIRNGTYQGR